MNDKLGNPIMISIILVWKVEDTYKAAFCKNFVKVQPDTAVRKLANAYRSRSIPSGLPILYNLLYITPLSSFTSFIPYPMFSGALQRITIKYLLGALVALFPLLAYAQPVQLIVRSDDMGFTHAANEAIIETCQQGITTSVEIMVPTPWYPEAVKMLREYPNLDVGIHLTLTSEWENLKWKPLTPALSLTDENGYFYPMIWPNENYGADRALQPQSWKLTEIERELRAQIERAQRDIPTLSHLTGHMGCSHLDERVTALVHRLAEEYGLAIFPEAVGVKRARLEGAKKTADEKISSFIAMLERLTPGTYLFVEHPAYNTPEVQAVHHIGYTDVAADRQGVTDMLTSDRVKEAIQRLNIQCISYADLSNSAKGGSKK